MPQFVSPGGMAGNAIQQFLMQRAMEDRQRMLDELMQQKQADDLSLRKGDLDLQRQQEARIAQAQTQQHSDMEQERQFRRASTIAGSALPDDPVDAQTRDLLTKQGYGGQVRQVPGIVSQGPLQTPMEQDPSGIPTYGVNQQPDSFAMRGGSQYMSARAAEEARAAQAAEANAVRVSEGEANRTAAGERADADRQTRELIAGGLASGRSETQGLRNDLLRTQIDAAGAKATDKQAADNRAKGAARQTAGAVTDLIGKLATIGPDGTLTLKPAAANLFGMRIPGASLVPGSETATAKAALERLKSRAVLDLIAEMKSQSRTGATGFGAMNERELAILESGATTLGASLQGDTAAAEELKRIYDIANQVMQGNTPAGGPQEYDYVNGKLVPRGGNAR